MPSILSRGGVSAGRLGRRMQSFRLNRASPQANGLLSWWPTVANGTVLEDYAGTNNGTLTNMTSTDCVADAECGLALNYDGTDNQVVIDNEANFDFEYSDPFSVFCWMKPTVVNVFQVLVDKLVDGGNYNGWEFLLYNETGNTFTSIQLYMLNNGAGATQLVVHSANNTVSAGVWQHVGFTYNGSGSASGVALYINGVATTPTINKDALAGTSILNNQAVKIGCRSGGTNVAPFNGLIDDVRIYRGVVAPAVVYQMWAPATRWDLYQPVRQAMVAVPSTANTYTITANAGAYVYTGTVAGLLFSRLLGAGAGSYSLTGTVAGLLKGRTLLALAGTYNLSGTAASLLFKRVLGAASAAYSLSGSTAGLLLGRRLPADSGSYSITGTAINFLWNRVILLASGAYSLGSSLVNLLYSAAPILANTFDFINVVRRRRK